MAAFGAVELPATTTGRTHLALPVSRGHAPHQVRTSVAACAMSDLG
jgi:hypothetical protein